MPIAVEPVLAAETGPDGVRDLLRDRELRRSLRAEVERVLGRGTVASRCRIDRVKLKPGRKLSAWGEVTVVREGEAQRVPVAATWEPAMRVLLSPDDPQLPELAALADARAVPGATGVTTLRYRPGQRHVLRYDVAGARHGTLFAKVVPGRDGSIAATVEAIAEALRRATPHGGVAVLRPVGRLPGGTVLYPHADGRALSEHLGPGRQLPARQLGHGGGALRALHELPPELCGERRASVDDDVAGTARAGEHIAVLDPTAGRALSEVLDGARSALSALTEEGPVATHGDCKLDHIWTSGDEVTFIDLDSCCAAEPARDLGKLLSDVSWAALAGRIGDRDDAQAAMLGGYRPSEERLARARAYEALFLAKATARRTSLLQPAWTARTRSVLQVARSLLTSGRAASRT